MKKFIEKNWFYIIIFLLITLLSYFFVYTTDDWFWASNDAVLYLKDGFKYYNGRYLSNIIIMIMSRNVVIKCLAYGLVTSLIVYLVNNLINKKNFNLAILFLVLFFLIENSVFSQGYVWASGFANYFISIIFMLYFMKLVCENKFMNLKPFLALILGIFSSLFLENVSILILLINLFLIIYSKLKKVEIFNIYYFIGSVIGTFAIFYNEIFYTLDTALRQISFNNIFKVFYSCIVPDYFGKSLLIMIPLIILTLLFVTFKRKNISMVNYAIFLIISIYYAVLNLCSKSEIVNAIFLIIYTVYSSILLIRLSEKDLKMRMIWYFALKVLYIAPLVVVSTLGPRLLLFPFIIDIMIILEIINLYLKPNQMSVIFMVFFFLFMTFKIVTYAFEYKKARSQQIYVCDQMEKNNNNILLNYDGYSPMFYVYLPFQNYFQNYYIEFYNVETDLEVFRIALVE